MTLLRQFRVALPFALATTLLTSCSGAPADPAAAVSADRKEQMVKEIATTLQACSYDGADLKVDPASIGQQAPADCRSMVERVMTYTGLPQNFVVAAGPVPNAMAAIVLDEQKVPRRVIAFNPDFITQVKAATGGDGWAPVSIMAHEIGHHLAGHTITEGHSRPEIELEADKFSGYVLYKMGAPLVDSTKAILAFGTPTDQPTHPGRDKRAAAITQGWQEACRQAGGNCSGGTAQVNPPAADPQVIRASLPVPSPASIPFKYGRFVVDETGKLDAATLAAFDRKLLALATDKGVEIAVLVVNDLHGMDPDDYAWAMMRQLRVGKLDLGNGGVFVIAPNQGTSGSALAPGVAKKLEFFDVKKRFGIWLDDKGWQRGCPGSDACVAYTGNLLDVVGSQLRFLDTAWQIRFNSIEDGIVFSKARLAERRAGRKWDDKIDQTGGSLIRFTGTVTDTAPKAEELRVNERITSGGKWRAVLVKTAEGQETTLYMQPRTAGLMPSGQLKVGQPYTFVGEINSTGQFHTDNGVIQTNPSLWLFSYEAL